MSLEPQLIRLKEIIFAVDYVAEQKTLIGAIIEEYKKESESAKRLAKDYAALQKEHAALKEAHSELQAAQLKKAPEFVLSHGVLWRRFENGEYERFPYCNECAHHPVMHKPSPMARVWICSEGHTAPRTEPPPPGF